VRDRPLDRLNDGMTELKVAGDELRNNFRVRLGREDVSGSFQLALQLAVIVNDAVVDDGDPLRGVRMGIDCRWFPWVANRVWPIPAVMDGNGAGRIFWRSFSVPGDR